MLIGIDIVDIDRIQTAVNRTPRFLTRVFTRQEVEYCFKKSNPYPSLAARFAAKEAVRKLHPVFIEKFNFHDVEIVTDTRGRPQLVLHGTALAGQMQAKFGQIDISLTHSRNQAIAAAVATRGDYNETAYS